MRRHPGLAPALGLFLLAAFGTAASSGDPGPSPEVVESSSAYQSQGKTIHVERFDPRTPGKHPAVVVLHGSGGLTLGGFGYRDTARRLARRGYVTHVIHYFDLTGTYVADPSAMKANFAAWMRAVADGLVDLRARPEVDADRVGLVGFSLGAYLSLSLGVFDERVAAVVDYYGGLPEVLAQDARSLPPTLILHGDTDRVVPITEARKLEKLYASKRVPFEVKVYQGQGHGFTGEAGTDAARRAFDFLDAHVKAAPTRHEVARPDLERYIKAAETAEVPSAR